MKHFYLGAAIAGAIVPYAFFLDFFVDEGIDLPAFIDALFANGAAGGFTADLLITSAVFWGYMFTRRTGPNPWPIVLVNLLIGLSCALPLYLYLQARADLASPAQTETTA